MSICLDASVAVAAFMPDPAKPQARQFVFDCLRRGQRLVAPPLLFAETTSVLRRYAYLGTIAQKEALAALEDFLTVPIVIIDDSSLYVQVIELAARLGHARAYDVQYLAAARIEGKGCEVVTLDLGLSKAATVCGVAAQLLA